MIGRRLGVYQIGSLLGSGGMGDVYRAHDTRLGRDVAIKVLPNAFAADADRLARFERESRMLASLNHPHIAAIYGVEESDGVRALVLELVDGQTLAERIAAGAIPLDEALPIARQIVDALDAAHEHGIVHRDLKPANIKLRPDGAVKVLDFGLAKALEPDPAGAELSNSPTVIHAGTRAHVILGTAAYMAPEQARGAAVDRRADVWAFGAVLYEMLTARRAFGGDDVTETIASVLRDEPDWSVLPASTPDAIRRLLRRTLIKSRRDRLADLSSIRLDIDEAMTSGAAGVVAPGPAIGAQRTAARRGIAGVATAAVIAAAIGGYTFRPATPDKPMAFSILPPEGTAFVSATSGGNPALSPDGRRIAFVAEGAAGRLLWVRSLDAFDARPLLGTEGAASPFWSPDGASLGFMTATSVKRVGLAGGAPQTLAAAHGSSSSAAGAWHPDGRILFYVKNRIFSVPAAGGDPVSVVERNLQRFEENLFAPSLLPDGRHYLLMVRGGAELGLEAWVGDLSSNDRRLLLGNVSNAQFAPAYGGWPASVLFVRNGQLMAQPFDENTRSLVGQARLVSEGMWTAGGPGDFAVSATGVLVYRRSTRGTQELAWFDRTGTQVGGLGDRPGNPRNNVRLSPDGQMVAFTRQGDTAQDVWLASLPDGTPSRFTLAGGRSPVWSPDGRYIAFLRDDTIYRKPVSGGGIEEKIWTAPGIMSVNDWSGDGRYLLLTRWEAKEGLNGRGIWLLSNPLDDGAKREAVFVPGSGLHGQFVPQIGAPRWISYDGSTDGAISQVFVATLPGAPSGRWQVSTDGANGSRWRPDGREVFFPTASYASMMSVEVDAGPAFHASAPRVLFPLPRPFSAAVGQYAVGYDVARDGQRFLTTLPSPDTPPSAIDIVINWQAYLGK